MTDIVEQLRKKAKMLSQWRANDIDGVLHNAAADEIERLRGAAQAGLDPATVEACAKVAENRGWMGKPYPGRDIADAIRALAVPSAQRECTCHPYTRDIYGHNKSCPLSSTHHSTEAK